MTTPLSTDLPSYASHRISQSFSMSPNIQQPPAPPPKPSSQEVSRQSTPSGQSLPLPTSNSNSQGQNGSGEALAVGEQQYQEQARLREVAAQDPGDRWLPRILEDKAKQDLASALHNPKILAALANARSTAHPSIAASQEPLQIALSENISLASHLNELEARLSHLRASTQSQLLATHSLERQWRQKQSDMDRALAPFSPSSLYQRLGQGVQEQELVCRALEESFLDGADGVATEREITDWVKRYRDSKKLYYSRRERKERWDEGRVGGWR